VTSAHTLPTKAERLRLRASIEKYPEDPSFVTITGGQARTALRLLDWADAQEAERVTPQERDPFIKLAAELVRMSYFEDGKRAAENVRDDMRGLGVRIRQAADAMRPEPARRTLRRLHEAARYAPEYMNPPSAEELTEAIAEAERVLSGGPPARAVGPWALRCPDEKDMWWKVDKSDFDGNGKFGHWDPRRDVRQTFTRLGPATEEGTARWAQRLHGGVVCRIRSKQ
jgi:hypothetical protein